MKFSLLLILTILGSGLVDADDIRPLYVEIEQLESASWVYKVQWRIPPTIRSNNFPTITLPKSCSNTLQQANRQRDYLNPNRLYRCEQSLSGSSINIVYPTFKPSLSTVVKFKSINGEQHTKLLAPQQNQWQIPRAETKSQVAKDYTLLGIEHIWAGIDHLLFILCLLWIAGSVRRVLITITGFTLAHSITLILSALQWVQLPIAPVEAVIALSIVFLATEIVKKDRHNNDPSRHQESLTWRYPIAVSSSFGLLHGFGFAAALNEIGLPQTELLTGLLCFNIGVEIGQVIIAMAALGVIYCFKRLTAIYNYGKGLGTISTKAISYSVGTIACFWLIERCLVFLPISYQTFVP